MTPAVYALGAVCVVLLARVLWLALDRDTIARLLEEERAQTRVLRGEVDSLKDSNRILYQQLQGWSSAKRADRRWVS